MLVFGLEQHVISLQVLFSYMDFSHVSFYFYTYSKKVSTGIKDRTGNTSTENAPNVDKWLHLSKLHNVVITLFSIGMSCGFKNIKLFITYLKLHKVLITLISIGISCGFINIQLLCIHYICQNYMYTTL